LTSIHHCFGLGFAINVGKTTNQTPFHWRCNWKSWTRVQWALGCKLLLHLRISYHLNWKANLLRLPLIIRLT